MGGELSDVRIMEGDDGRGAIVSFPFDAAFVERFRMAFPRARWSDRLRAWRLPGTTAARRVTRWLDRELPATFTNADERGRDSFSFEPIVSPYLSTDSEIIVRTPYSRTVVAELRAVPWAWWHGEDKAWHIPFRSVDALRERWAVIEAAAQRNEPEARKMRSAAAKSAPEYEGAKAKTNERRRQRYPVPATALPPLDRVLMSHEGPLVVMDVTGEIVPAEIARQHYPWSELRRDDLIWALWRRPTHDELIKAWPARRQPAADDFAQGWWQPTLSELRDARRAARSLERALETRKQGRSTPGKGARDRSP